MIIEYENVCVNMKNVTSFKIYKRNIVFLFTSALEGQTFKFENEDEALKAFKLITNAYKSDEKYLSLN
jgi:hypothetical protein